MKIYMVILISLFLWNCHEDEVFLWQGKNCIYFSQMDAADSKKFANEMGFSFGLTNVMDTVIQIPVTASGDTVGYDRYFSFVIDSTTGEEGVHFDLPEKGILPAGSATGYVPVSLYRVLDDNEIYYLYFRLLSDEEFEVNIPEAYTSRDTSDLTRFTFSFSSSIAKPTYWIDSWFGYFSLAKYNLFEEISGGLDLNKAPTDAMFLNTVATLYKNYINSKILEGKESALRDPQNQAAGEKGFMTVRGSGGYKNLIPEEWLEDE